ncbi:hypothetical protein CERSUDRAFT_78200 [Gelatoporia subvermispora B]|uniref:Uncharacterized protein n=1 Tax=Ceriporiopsis subvermispora (strain B) TaxID=914234 RepID=M2Q3S2_CERS8|nr:hypothetical protein CERSUDRAFT_78200 [Gelatoporia subvermispora B]
MNLGSTLGAAFLGQFLSVILFGVTSLQAWAFFGKSKNDPWVLKLLCIRSLRTRYQAYFYVRGLDTLHVAFLACAHITALIADGDVYSNLGPLLYYNPNEHYNHDCASVRCSVFVHRLWKLSGGAYLIPLIIMIWWGRWVKLTTYRNTRLAVAASVAATYGPVLSGVGFRKKFRGARKKQRKKVVFVQRLRIDLALELVQRDLYEYEANGRGTLGLNTGLRDPRNAQAPGGSVYQNIIFYISDTPFQVTRVGVRKCVRYTPISYGTLIWRDRVGRCRKAYDDEAVQLRRGPWKMLYQRIAFVETQIGGCILND